jgi:hypothetical protein
MEEESTFFPCNMAAVPEKATVKEANVSSSSPSNLVSPSK